jgi:cell fate regulator YaaT (PSP1 superfamily)
LEKATGNKENEEHAFKVCKEKIEQRRLQMKLVKVHYILEEGKILFFFTADNRVDFRELVKDLVSVFKTRIELRQIGIRDESRIMGGCGICGRPYCCHTISDKLKPVSIKMAKEQNLSLNSMKISGSCGRLLCCLSYEHNFYIEERKNYPFEGERISWDGVIWRVRELNVIAGIVTLDSEDGRQLIIPRKRFLKVEKNGWKIT